MSKTPMTDAFRDRLEESIRTARPPSNDPIEVTNWCGRFLKRALGFAESLELDMAAKPDREARLAAALEANLLGLSKRVEKLEYDLSVLQLGRVYPPPPPPAAPWPHPVTPSPWWNGAPIVTCGGGGGGSGSPVPEPRSGAAGTIHTQFKAVHDPKEPA